MPAYVVQAPKHELSVKSSPFFCAIDVIRFTVHVLQTVFCPIASWPGDDQLPGGLKYTHAASYQLVELGQESVCAGGFSGRPTARNSTLAEGISPKNTPSIPVFPTVLESQK